MSFLNLWQTSVSSSQTWLAGTDFGLSEAPTFLRGERCADPVLSEERWLFSRYRMAVYARDIDGPHTDWVKMPDLLDARMWQGCLVTQIADQRGILVVGGNGLGSSGYDKYIMTSFRLL